MNKFRKCFKTFYFKIKMNTQKKTKSKINLKSHYSYVKKRKERRGNT